MRVCVCMCDWKRCEWANVCGIVATMSDCVGWESSSIFDNKELKKLNQLQIELNFAQKWFGPKGTKATQKEIFLGLNGIFECDKSPFLLPAWQSLRGRLLENFTWCWHGFRSRSRSEGSGLCWISPTCGCTSGIVSPVTTANTSGGHDHFFEESIDYNIFHNSEGWSKMFLIAAGQDAV